MPRCPLSLRINSLSSVLYEKNYTIYIGILSLLLLGLQEAKAFDLSVYRENSALSAGKWVKVRVDEDGLYRISASTLRSWGFSDLSKVVIRGYGGHRLSDELSEADYIDDLPAVQSITDATGIVFYGVGAGEWKNTTQGAYYRQNDYSVGGHYFVGELADGEEGRTIPSEGSAYDNAYGSDDTFTDYVHHELERVVSPGEAGPMLLGEDFRYTNTRTISMAVPDIVGNSNYFRASFVSNLSTSGSILEFTVNGVKLPLVDSDRLKATTSSIYVHGTEAITRHLIDADAGAKEKFDIQITFKPSGAVEGIWLNYLSLSYTRRLRLPDSGYLMFRSPSALLSLDGAKSGVSLLNVTDPLNITKVESSEPKDSHVYWSMSTRRDRVFAAWNPSAKLPSPVYVGKVDTQNLHSHAGYDMVIVAPSAYKEAALRLADFHRNSSDTLTVAVVTPEEVYNEFSSGTVDPGAFRRYFKMLYDRSTTSSHPLKYAILMGRVSLDNRGLTASALSYPSIPAWMPSDEGASLNDNLGYCTDDLMAMLEDNSGRNIGLDNLSIAIGRIPVSSASDASQVVDKLIEYAAGSRRTSWKQRMLFLADDQDSGIHLTQTEAMQAKFCDAEDSPFLIRKVYMDAYELQGDTYPEARSAMFRLLDEGVVWWNFIGHANISEWTHEHQLSYTDLNNMYLRHWPFIYAATCNFLRIDGTAVSGGELMFKERYGGAVGIISAVRPVYISDNGLLSNALGRALAMRDDKGRVLPPGELYRRAKNDIRDSKDRPLSDTNRLRFVFIGDPALRLAVPSNTVVLDSVNGRPIDEMDQPTLAALERATLAGHVEDGNGNIIEDFNGTLLADLFDAEHTVTTKGNGKTGKVDNYEDIGERIFSGSAKIEAGRFSLSLPMPMEISQNFRPATITLYACTDDGKKEAASVDKQLYVYGYDENAPVDDNPPVIEAMYLNSDDFANGDVVNIEPMLIASLRDDVGINLSNAGVGHQISVLLDDRKSFTGLSNYFTPASDGSASGTLAYPMDELAPGNHSLRLRVWDTAGNSSEKTIDFFVSQNAAPKIYDIFTDVNPASTQVNFYLRHNRPDQQCTVTYTVYNLVGRPVWSTTVNGRSDMFLTMPVTWNLTDYTGRRVGRGIYVYRATISTNGSDYETATHRLAVTAQ